MPAREHMRVSPVTGREWRHGEMQEVVEHHAGLARGWVLDVLQTEAVNRAGDVAMSAQPFRLVAGEVEWLEPRQGQQDEHEATGRFPEALRAFMDDATVEVVLARTGASPELDYEEARAAGDRATTEFLLALGHGVLMAARPGSALDSQLQELDAAINELLEGD